MANKKLRFAVTKTEMIDENLNSRFATAKIHAFSTGKTEHDTTCDAETLKNMSPTLYEKPIVFDYNPAFNDFKGHNNKSTPLIAGFVVPDSAEFIELDDGSGRIGVTVIAKIWKKYSNRFMEVFMGSNEKTKSVSVEMEVTDYEEQSDGLLNLKNFIFDAICVLGDSLTPASPGAKLELLSFSKEYQEDVKREFDVKYAVDSIRKQLDNIENKLSYGLYGSYNDDSDENNHDDDLKKSEEANVTLSSKESELPVENYLGMEEMKNMANNKDEKAIPEKEKEFAEEVVSEKENEKETPKEEMAVEKKVEKPKEEMALEVEVEEKDEPENEEEMAVEKAKAMSMSLNESLDVKAMLSFLQAETKSYQEMTDRTKSDENLFGFVSSFAKEIAKGKNAQAKTITNDMLSYMKESKSIIQELSKTNFNYSKELNELREYKKNSENEKLNFEIESVLSEALNFGMPEEEVEELRGQSVEFSLENIDIYKNMVKAKTFVFSSSKKKEEETIIKIGLPFMEKKPKEQKLWE